MNNRSITPEDHEAALREARSIVHFSTVEATGQYRLAQAYLTLAEQIRHGVAAPADERRALAEAEGYLAEGIQEGALPAEAHQVIDRLRRLRTRLEVAREGG